MIHNIYISPGVDTYKKDTKRILESVKYKKFRLIFDIDLKVVDINLLKPYFKFFEENKIIIEHLVKTFIILKGTNSVKKGIIQTFIKMIKKERPVEIL